MTDSTHTPLPWHVEPTSMRGQSLVVGGDIRDRDGFSLQFSDANAALIVKAVNCHADLVAALKLAEDVLSRAPFSTEVWEVWPNGTHPNAGIEQIRAAIAKAEGRS